MKKEKVRALERVHLNGAFPANSDTEMVDE